MLNETDRDLLRKWVEAQKFLKLDANFDKIFKEIADEVDTVEQGRIRFLVIYEEKGVKKNRGKVHPKDLFKGNATNIERRTDITKKVIFGPNNEKMPGVSDAVATDVAFAVTQHVTSIANTHQDYLKEVDNWADRVGEIDFTAALNPFTADQAKLAYNAGANQNAYRYSLMIAATARAHFKGAPARVGVPTTVYAQDLEWYEDLAFALNHYYKQNVGKLPEKLGAMGSGIVLASSRTGAKHPPGGGHSPHSTWTKVSITCRVLSGKDVIVDHFSPEEST